MLRGAGGKAVDHFDGSLVVAVHEVYLESLDAHVGIRLADGLQVLVHHVEHGPEHDANALGIRIFYELWQLDFIDRLQDASILGVVPSLVQHDVFQSVVVGEIYIIFVRLVVDACLEVHSFQVPVVPPVPSHLSGLDPGCVTYLVGGGEGIHQVVGGHLGVFLCDGEHAPGIVALAGAGGDVVAGLCHMTHVAPGIVCHLLGVGGEDCLELVAVSLQPHSGIAHEVALQDGDLRLAAVHGGRQEGECLLGGVDAGLVVDVLESHGEGLLRGGGVG